MSKPASFERINYLLRPNKQVERKMIIDFLSNLSLDFPIANYHYVGMGSIYYYDFILMHKYLNMSKMTSIDNKSCYNRFLFNKPYDFVRFENCDTSDYLARHNYKENSFFWLDYDGHISGNEYLKKDISFLGKNCINGDIYYVTVNCEAPEEEEREAFLVEFARYIPEHLRQFKNTSPSLFPNLVQEILLNMIEETSEYNTNKFIKTSSYLYRDGSLMYTLGGIFSDNRDQFVERYAANKLFRFERDEIFKIKVPNITYKEKFYLDSNITILEDFVLYSKEYWINNTEEGSSVNKNIDKHLASELEFELSYQDILNYLKSYRFVPQYYESLI